MSTESVTTLLELASEHIDYWNGKGIGSAIEADIQRSDYDSLRAHMLQSSKLIYDFERQSDDDTSRDFITDERAEHMTQELTQEQTNAF